MAGDARAWSQETQERQRQTAVRLVLEEGLTRRAAARALGVHEETVGRWTRAFRREGAGALARRRRGRRPGEQQALAPWQQGQIVQAIREKNPDQLKLPFVLWTREAVRDLIERRFGIRLSLSTVGGYLKRWGFTPQKPLRRAFEQNAAAVARWLDEQYPALAKRAKAEGARIMWGDEMGLRSDHQAGRSFAPRGETPIVPKTGKRFSCSVIQAISNRGELCFRVFRGTCTQEVFIDFLARLARQAAARKTILIVDGHPAHRGRKAKAWIERNSDRIEVVYLPGYSPELNPAECLNNDTKHAVLVRQRPADQDELVGATRRHLHRRQKQPAQVSRFFHEQHVAYAAHLPESLDAAAA